MDDQNQQSIGNPPAPNMGLDLSQQQPLANTLQQSVTPKKATVGELVNYHHNGKNAASFGLPTQIWPAIIIAITPAGKTKDDLPFPETIKLRVFNEDTSSAGKLGQALAVPYKKDATTGSDYYSFYGE